MNTLTITKAMLDADNTYVGETDVTEYDGHIEIAADLGCVRFTSGLSAAGSLRALAGSGIEAGWGIKADFSIIAKFVTTKQRIFVGLCLWREPKPDEMELRAELRSGTLAFGRHVHPALPESDAVPVTDGEAA